VAARFILAKDFRSNVDHRAQRGRDISSAGGCLMTVADSPLVETASDAPPRAKDASAYIPVHGVPLDRIEPAMDPGQRAKMQAELIAARDRQASSAAPEITAPAARKAAAK